MEKRVVKITVAKDGTHRIEAMEGFSGESCINKTKDIELALGGIQIDSGKKDSYYEGDDTPVSVDIQL